MTKEKAESFNFQLPRGKMLAAQEGHAFGSAAIIHTALPLGSTKNTVLLSKSSFKHSRRSV